MNAPGWAKALLAFLAPPHRVDDVVGDLEETHRDRVARRGRLLGTFLTCVEALDMGFTILRDRIPTEPGDGVPAVTCSPGDLCRLSVGDGVGV